MSHLSTVVCLGFPVASGVTTSCSLLMSLSLLEELLYGLETKKKKCNLASKVKIRISIALGRGWVIATIRFQAKLMPAFQNPFEDVSI